MDTVEYFILFLFICIVIYAIIKERRELGCYRVSIDKQCNDENSVYLIGTKTNSSDTIDDLFRRMTSILSYHEKAGVWRKCIILSTSIVLITYISNQIQCDKNSIYYWFYLLILICAIIYFYFNFINYHHFRSLKNNGIEILDKIKLYCKKN